MASRLQQVGSRDDDVAPVSAIEVRGERALGNRVPEAVLHRVWRQCRTATTGAGELCRVLYSGRSGGASGPDFRDAVVEMPGGRRVYGDVEIHVEPSGWRTHGHRQDGRYDRVTFHVTPGGESRPVFTSSGLSVTSLHIDVEGSEEAVVAFSDPPQRAAPCEIVPRMPVWAAGDQRFIEKSDGFLLEMTRESPEQVVWSAILDVLGYSENRRAFRRVAQRLPWKGLATLQPALAKDDLESLCLWAGGLGPRPEWSRRYFPNSVRFRPPRWNATHGRPANAPVRRLRAAGYLAARFIPRGALVDTIADSVLKTERPVQLLRLFVVHAGGNACNALIGEGRGSEIAVNAVLPSIHAWARRTERWHVAERAFALFRGWPKTPENSISREMRAVLRLQGRDPVVRGARGQQGLIHLYRLMTQPVSLRRSA